ncbi:MAG: magnesium and cobalt transport protein CorA [Actinomycetota bacterium]|nr:magnesium and cobalt transport protein CorA [Actinomycetota bacterium]
MDGRRTFPTVAPNGGPRRTRHSGTSDIDRAIVDCALYCGGRRQGGTLPLDVASEQARSSPDAFVWLGLHQPDAAALAAAAAEFSLPPLAVEDAVHAHQRPKLDQYGDVLFLVLKTVRYVDSEEVVVLGEVMVFVGDSYVVTVRHGDAPALGDVRRVLEDRPDLLALGPSAVLWGVADAVVDAYSPALDGLETDVDEVEDQVFGHDRNDPTQRIYTLIREVLEVSRAVHPLVAATERLADGEVAGLHPGTVELFRDVHDHVLRADDRVRGLDALLQGTLDANVAQVTLRQNEDMRKISAYAAILTVCTTLAGIYGMNFEHMPELEWQFGYPFALGLMATISYLLYRGFKRNGWL